MVYFFTPCFFLKPEEAESLIYNERSNSASDMLHNLIKGDRNNEEAWYLLTICYPEQNKLKEIKDSLQSVSNTPLMKSSYGHILLRENNAAGAKQYFDEALKETRKKMPQC